MYDSQGTLGAHLEKRYHIKSAALIIYVALASGTGEKAGRESKYSKNGMHTSKIQGISIIFIYMVFTKKHE